MRAEVVTLGPDLAKKWRLTNTANFRKLNKQRVGVYAADMAAGNWKLNGEPICFDTDGKLVNGQHRVEAVIMSGATIQTLVVWDVEKLDGGFYDFQLPRTPVQWANAAGAKISNAKCAAVSFIANESGNKKTVGRIEVINYYTRNQTYFDLAYSFATTGTKPILRKAGCIAALYCGITLNILNYDQFIAFCRVVNTGMPVEEFICEPAFVLRNMLIEFGKYSGSQFIIWCFENTYLAMERFQKQLEKKTRYNSDGSIYKDIIKKVKSVETMMQKGEAV